MDLWGDSPFDSRTMDIPMRESTAIITSREMPMPFQFLSGPMGPMSYTARDTNHVNNNESCK